MSRDWRGCAHVWETMPNHAFERCVLCGMTIEYSGFWWWRTEKEIHDDAGNVLWRKGQ